MKTFGTATFRAPKRGDKPQWVIEAEPHVILRMKRVFGKISKRSHGRLCLTDTAENARDLEWFCERYPLEIRSPEQLARRAGEFRARAAQIASLLDGTRAPRAFELALPPREYQRIAAELTLITGGLLLADDVGIGKTVSAICTFADPRTLPATVVTLTHLPRQWEAEVQRFAPALRTHIVKKGTPYDLADRAGETPDVVILNYHKLSGWADWLGAFARSIVFDEVQELRHADSNRYAAAKHVAERASFRLGLSATPIYNYGAEIFNVLDVLRPGEIGERQEFYREWCGGGRRGEKSRMVNPRAFGTHVRDLGLMLRRTRAEVGRELPALTRVPHYVDADTSHLEQIESRAAELARLILGNNPMARGEKWQASEELSFLVRQATGIAKARYVADFVRLLVESGESVVLYGWHREVYSIWLERLRDLAPALYTGSENARQKDEARRRFVAGETPVLVMSLRSGAGLDGLQKRSRTVVFGELDWSPGVHEQCAGRLHRDGQTEPVVAYFLVADSGSDPVIADTLGLKRAQIEGLRDPHAPLVATLEAGEGNVRRLAAALLERRGEVVSSAA